MADKINVQGDPYWAKATSNIAEMFNPKAAAQGSNLLAQTRLNNAKAAGAEDQNDALTVEALAKAGYSPMEIAAMRAARDNSVSSIFKGINSNRGREALGRGDLVASSVLTGQASALPEIQKAITIKDYVTGADGKTDKGLAGAFLADGGKNIDGNLLSWAKDGTPILGPVTGVGQSIIDKNKVTADTIKATGDANIEYKGIQGDMLKDKTAAQIESIASLTDAKIEEMVANGADRRSLNEARRQAIATKAAATKPVDVVKGANAEAVLLSKIDELYSNDFAQLGDKKAWALLDPTEKAHLRNRTVFYIKNENLGLTEAMAKANAYYGITGNPSDTTQGQKGIVFKENNGKIYINGFRVPPESTADVVAAGSTGASTAPVPAIKVPDKKEEPKAVAPVEAPAPAAKTAPAKEVKPEPGVIIAKTQADIDNAPPGAIIEVNGRRFKKPVPPTK
jgi:hypothetical protein